MTELIQLRPPLLWSSSQGPRGYVMGCAPDRLRLQLSPGESPPSSITVSLPNGQDFRFQGVPHPTQSDWDFVVASNEQSRLGDLLGQIRKDQHIEICRSEDVESSDRFTGFEQLSFLPEALPLFDQSQIDSHTVFLGRRFALPLLITGMTGGIQKGAEINRRLALAAQAYDIPMGVGSQRIALDNAEYAPIFAVKSHAPDVFLIGNIGIAQLADARAFDRCQRAVDMIEADALAIHFNMVQEHIQVEGDRHFAGILKNIEAICKRLSVPVIAKEVGCGIAPHSARQLAEIGIKAIDIGGAGGTSWARIEGLRSSSPLVASLGASFRNWGIPTAYSLAAVREALAAMPLIATGGIRDGVAVAKAAALGANLVGVGLPLLKAALIDDAAPLQVLEEFKRGLELTMIASGSRRLGDLRVTRGRPLEAAFHRLVPSL